MKKITYERPQIELVKFESEDIITASGLGNENIGEWDPQSYTISGRSEEGR